MTAPRKVLLFMHPRARKIDKHKNVTNYVPKFIEKNMYFKPCCVVTLVEEWVKIFSWK